jgi:hypothetical protein
LEFIKKINYFIKPLNVVKDISDYKNYNLLNSSITYNILPLIDKQVAKSYGTINTINNGIDDNMINRYNTYIVDKITTNFSKKDIDQESPLIYSGSNYKLILHPYNKVNDTWYVSKGVNENTYKYNEILSEKILKNMKIKQYNFKTNAYKNNINELVKYVKLNKTQPLENNISEFCFNKITEIENKYNYILKKELYLYQFFNILDIIFKYNNNTDLIEIIPNNNLFNI